MEGIVGFNSWITGVWKQRRKSVSLAGRVYRVQIKGTDWTARLDCKWKSCEFIRRAGESRQLKKGREK
jgi:hypothetical protein